MKKLTILLLLAALLLCGCAQESAEETTQPTYSGEFLQAQEIGNSGYRCITGESDTVQTPSAGNSVLAKAFSHRIYNPEGDYVVTLTSTVIAGTQADSTGITSVTASLTDAQHDGFTVSEHVSGNTGTVVLYWNQLSVCHFQYRIQDDGSLEYLQ